MNLPTAILTVKWLAWDTFRQALSSGVFWILLAITSVCTLFCLSARVSGGLQSHSVDQVTEFLPAGDRDAGDSTKAARHGVPVVQGHITLGFGAFRFPLGRDAEDSVRLLQLLLAGGVADTLGLLLALLWTAGLLPAFLEPRSATVLLAKPLSRGWILFGKYLGVVMFVTAYAVNFVLGTWMALGLATGVWIAEYWFCVPILFIHFAIMYTASLVLAVFKRNTAACALGALFFWLMCWGVNFGRHALKAMTSQSADSPVFTSGFQWLVEGVYWAFPKPADFNVILQELLEAGSHFAGSSVLDAVRQQGEFSPMLSILTSVLFAACMLGVAFRRFAATDY